MKDESDQVLDVAVSLLAPENETSEQVAPKPWANAEVPLPTPRVPRSTVFHVLGIDPGLEVTGYAVLTGQSLHPKLREAGALRIPAKLSLPERLNYLHTQLRELMQQHQPTHVAVEELYSHYAHPRTAILMGHARGVMLQVAAEFALPVVSYLPKRVKKTMTGNGNASKEQMQLAVQREFRLATIPNPPDVADAMAIALCHYQSLIKLVA